MTNGCTVMNLVALVRKLLTCTATLALLGGFGPDSDGTLGTLQTMVVSVYDWKSVALALSKLTIVVPSAPKFSPVMVTKSPTVTVVGVTLVIVTEPGCGGGGDVTSASSRFVSRSSNAESSAMTSFMNDAEIRSPGRTCWMSMLTTFPPVVRW